MANVTGETSGGRTVYRISWRDADNRRRRIRVGGVTKKDAEAIASKIQAIVASQISQRPLDNATAHWVANLGDDLHAKLAYAGLVVERRQSSLANMLVQFIEDRRADGAAESTLCNFRQAERCLLEHLGEDRDLRAITAEESHVMRRELASRYAEATCAKLIKRARQVFAFAIKRGYCEENPFAEVRVGCEENDERRVFVSRAAIDAAIAKSPDAEWRAIIALARYGGLRTPSETLRLRWRDIDWEAGVFRVTSPKTRKQGKPFRVVPIFVALRPHLEALWDVAPEGAEYVVNRYRAGNSNLRTQFERILTAANVEPWPRLFQNCRASLETELTDDHPLHVVTAWLGNSPKVAAKHYLSVTPAPIARANGNDRVEGGPGAGAQGSANGRKPAPTAGPGARKNLEKTPFSRGFDDYSAPPVGLEDTQLGLVGARVCAVGRTETTIGCGLSLVFS